MIMTNGDSINRELNNKQELNKQSKAEGISFGREGWVKLHPILKFLICIANLLKR